MLSTTRKQFFISQSNKFLFICALTTLFQHVLCDEATVRLSIDYKPDVGDESCSLDESAERLQVAYVVDNTFSPDVFKKKISDIAQRLFQQLNAMHKTEFAITSFADYPSSAQYVAPGKTPGHDDPEECYNRQLKFTTDYSSVMQATQKINWLAASGSSEENSFTAVAFCAADTQLGWVRGATDNAGRRNHRFIVLLTDQWNDFHIDHPGNRKRFRGDGSDSCQTTLPVSWKEFTNVLNNKDIHVIGAYVINQNIHNQYVREFKNHGIENRHCHRNKAFTNVDTFAQNLEDLVVRCVKEFLKCKWQDPPSFNTLGL